jgi:hypothetical protein
VTRPGRSTGWSIGPAYPGIASHDAGGTAAHLTLLQQAVGNRTVARLVAAYAGNGSGASVSLHGQTEPNFDNGTSKVTGIRAARSTGCDCSEGEPCYQVTGTITITYKADPVITMPDVPDGLTPCQERRVRDFLRNVLGPHEQEHARRIRTYNGTTSRPFATKGCGKDAAMDAAKDKAQEMHDTENERRAKDADALSLAIDPFTKTIDLDCKDR